MSFAVKSIFKPNMFQNTAAIVTGGGTGIGKSIAYELKSLGCAVTIASRNYNVLQATAAEINNNKHLKDSPNLEFIRCNIRKEDEVIKLIDQVMNKQGRIDFLVNNGGGQFISKMEDITLKGWNAVIETNLTGTFLCIKEVFNRCMHENGGSIVNIIMDISKGFPLMSHSAASRAGVETLTKCLVNEWSQYNININCIAPGMIHSESALKNYGESGPKLFDLLRRKTPAKRYGNTEEISAAVCFLLSPAAKFITGQTIAVDGGLSHYHYQSDAFPDHKKSVDFSWK